MGWNYLSIPKLQRLYRLSLGMDKYFHPTLYWACDYLSMLGLKLNHVSKRGHSRQCYVMPKIEHQSISSHLSYLINSDIELYAIITPQFVLINCCSAMDRTGMSLTFSAKKMYFKILSAKCRIFCTGLNVLMIKMAGGVSCDLTARRSDILSWFRIVQNKYLLASKNPSPQWIWRMLWSFTSSSIIFRTKITCQC